MELYRVTLIYAEVVDRGTHFQYIYLFILAIEPLAYDLKRNKNVLGINVNGQCYLIGQYADDMFLLLKDDEFG